MVLVNEISCAVCGGEGVKYMRRKLYPSGVATARSTLIWRVFIRGTKLAARSSYSLRLLLFFLCGAKGWPEGAGNEPSRRDEAELKWNCEGWEGNGVNRRRRYKNKKYCARKALIVLFALASLLWLFHPFLSSSERTLEWGKKSLRILQKGWQCVLCSSESIQWEVCDDKYILGKLSFHLFSKRHGLPSWTVFGYL